MTVQTTYTKRIRKALNGEVAWDFGTADITSAASEGVTPFGVAVIKGTNAGQVKPGNASILGWTVRSLLNQYAINNSFPGPAVEAYGDKETVAVMREGYIWLTNKGGAALTEGLAAYANAAGELVNSAAAGAALVPGTRVEIGGAVGEPVLIRAQANITAPAP